MTIHCNLKILPLGKIGCKFTDLKLNGKELVNKKPDLQKFGMSRLFGYFYFIPELFSEHFRGLSYPLISIKIYFFSLRIRHKKKTV